MATEFGFSQRTAQYRMNVAARFGTKSETVALLNDAVLYLLAAPSTPDLAVRQVVKEAKVLGRSPTKAQVWKVIKETRSGGDGEIGR